MRNIARSALVAALLVASLSGCTNDNSSVAPTAVLDQQDTRKYGKIEAVQGNLRTSLELAVKGYEEEQTLALNSDYFNVREQDISYSEDWPTSLGMLMMHLVSVYPKADRIVFASKDNEGVCWYVEITAPKKEPKIRYGASNEGSCVASKVDTANTSWEDLDFPLSAPVPQAEAAGNGNGAAQAKGTAKPVPSATPTK